jgi:hypothetical protein
LPELPKLVIAGIENAMMEARYGSEHQNEKNIAPQARYSYYRRCQVFRKNGEQCKAPAEKGAQICHAHAGQLAMAVRRERERRAVLAEAVAEMSRRGKLEFEAKDLFMDFNAIQVTIAVIARALIDDRIDCKTAGRLAVSLQMASKLLRMAHSKGTSTTEARRHGGDLRSPQICAEKRRLSPEKRLTTKDTKGHEGTPRTAGLGKDMERTARAGKAEIILISSAKRAAIHAERTHGPPEWARAHEDGGKLRKVRVGNFWLIPALAV